MKFDLHCHSTASDGKLTPIQLLEQALEAELELFAITDHDTVAGYDALCQQSELLGQHLTLVSGVEFSTQWSGVGIHIIGLDFDPRHDVLMDFVERQRVVRKDRAFSLDQKLEKLGMPNTLQGALQYCGDLGQIGRPHFAQYLLDQGYVKTTKQAFDRWLGNGKVGDIKAGWPTVEEAVACINAAGGVAVLAHPLRYKMTFSKLRRLMMVFSEVGGAAVEVVGHQSAVDKKQQLIKVVKQLGLAVSGGSDFHDPEWRWSQLGKIEDLPSDLTPIWHLFNRTKLDASIDVSS